MPSLRPVGRSAATLDKDRKSLCRFPFADGRQCRAPRSPHHPHFCSGHARKDSQARAANKLACELSYFLSGQYLSVRDLSSTLGRLLPAVVLGDIKPRSARTLSYLSQTLAPTIYLSNHDPITPFASHSPPRPIPNSIPPTFPPS